MRRIYKLKIYFQDSPTPYFIENVWHIQTEGNLLRLIIGKEGNTIGKSMWYPLSNIAYLKEIEMVEE